MSKRIDAYLVEKGYAKSRERAKNLIKSGGVYINSAAVSKPSEAVSEGDTVTVTISDLKYVGRGALKLEKAFEAFDINVTGMVCADIGASTGGFTEVLLEKGAEKVYAVDVGHGQLDKKLQNNSRVVNCEGTNARELTSDHFSEAVDFFSVDVSFISLKHIMNALSDCSAYGCIFAVLIKPQFEAGREKVGKKGVVRDPAVHREVIEMVTAYAQSISFAPCHLEFSPIKGPEGNIEYLVHLVRLPDGVTEEETNVDVDAVVKSAHDTLDK